MAAANRSMSNLSFARLKNKLKRWVLMPKWQGPKKKQKSMSSFSDFFSLLSVLPSFDVDIAHIEKAYFREQRLFHPDRFIGKTEEEKLQAMQRSADINQAYETLKDPLKRAQYLLLSQGMFVGTEKDSVKPSQELLMEIMELREHVESAGSPTALFGIADKLKEECERTLRLISVAYGKSEWDKMAGETLKLSYLQKTLDDIRKQKR